MDIRRRGLVTGRMLGVLLASGAICITGCVPGPDSTEPHARSTPSRFEVTETSGEADLPSVAPDSDTNFRTPYAEYMLTTTERAVIDHARTILLDRCVAEFGFSYPTIPFSERLSRLREDERVMMSRLFGPTDRAAASRWGYLPPPGSDDEQWELEAEAASQPDFVAVMTGEFEDVPGSRTTESRAKEIPEGGCFGEVDRSMGLDQTPNDGVDDLARGLWVGLSQVEQSLPEFQKVNKEWATCMAENGYGERTLVMNDPYVDRIIAARSSVHEPSQNEIAMTLADIDCKEDTDLVERLLTVTTSYQHSVIEENILALQESRAFLDDVVRKATEEVENLGGFQ